ncbi:MAG: DUF2442 domain-containing protein [Synergistaceae bacterium]|nr:DUF2442 domain-containing protein [Synergistaceae bacterium]
MEFHRLKNITPLPDFVLRAEFLDGSRRIYDVKPLMKKIPVFQMLEYVHGLFGQVRVDTGGCGIIWNDEIDISSDEIYENGMITQ